MWSFLIPKDKFARWERTRAKGFWRVVIVGGFCFALPFALSFTLLQIIGSVYKHFFEIESFISFLGMCLVGGFFWSISFWYSMEYTYRKYKNGKTTDE